jgi:transposase
VVLTAWRFAADEVASRLFPPQHESEQEAQEELQHLVGRAPEQVNQEGSRWKLETIRAACPWLERLTLSGIWRVLDRLEIGLKRGRAYLHSPDEHYFGKLSDVVAAFEAAVASDGRIIFLFSDELTFYRQPSIAKDYSPLGADHQPLALRSVRSDTTARAIAAINAVTGQTTSLLASKIGVKQLIEFHQAIRADYPQAEEIYLAEDNWPVHFHRDVLASLEEQRTRWEFYRPTNWPTEPSRKTKRLDLPIQLLPLPTYAPWTNPTEKLWRWLKQEILHLHRLADDWQTLKLKVKDFLDRFRQGSLDLLRYIGLTPNSKLYGGLCSTSALEIDC